MPLKEVLRHQLIREIDESGKLDLYVKAGIFPFSLKSNYLAFKKYVECIDNGERTKDAIIEMTIQGGYSERRAYTIVQFMNEKLKVYES